MSGTAAGSSSARASPAPPPPPAAANGASHAPSPHAPAAEGAADLASIQAYLQARGYNRALTALNAELAALPAGAPPAAALAGAAPLSAAELAAKNAPRDARAAPAAAEAPRKKGDNAGDKERAAARELARDCDDRERGFQALRAWCQGSLESYLPELQPLLLPLFVHSFLDLVEAGSGSAAAALYSRHSALFLPLQLPLLSHLRALSLPSHVAGDALAQRFRSERYVLKMSAVVFGLLLGWLTDGGGPVAGAGAAEGLGKGTREMRGRTEMLRIINERCRLQVIQKPPHALTSTLLEEGTGLTGAGPSFSSFDSTPRSLLSSHMSAPALTERDAVAEYNSNAAGPHLKLGGQVPLSERLKKEVEREIKEEDMREEAARQKKEQEDKGGEAAPPADADAMKVDAPSAGADGTATGAAAAASPNTAGDKAGTPSRESARPSPGPGRASTVAPTTAPATTTTVSSGLLQPEFTDLPPQPPLFRSVDVDREVSRIRDARKALRLGEAAAVTPAGDDVRTAALPSVCSFTYHDAEDGLTCSTFSADASLMAAGFEESYVQVWSLKGEPLRGLKENFEQSNIRDARSLRKNRESTTQTTRKLIGHSAPVYGVSFDPIAGTAAPPRHLLSCSGDGSARLWSLDTFSALVAYRGHQGPVWNVEWSPLGTYFATASADRTARLWSTERITPLRMYAGHLSDVECLNFHPNSLYLATGSSDRTCRLWDVQRGACVRLFVGHQSPISCVRISPDGRYLASAGAGNAPFRLGATAAGDDAAISLWDLSSGRRVKKMWGHRARVLDLDFSTDGGMLMSSGSDCTVRCWDVRSAGGERTDVAVPGSLEAQQAAVAGIDAADRSAALAMPAAVGAQLTSDERDSSRDCLATFYTKRTPMLDVHVTPRNLVLTAGAYDASI